MSNSVVVFDSKALAKDIFNNLVPYQTNLLIDYAMVEIKKLGDRIASYNSANGLDRTGNLLNSLCWGVTYDGVLKASGFYREETHKKRTNRKGDERGFGVHGGNDSFLHEFFGNDAELVEGRKLAKEYLQNVRGKANKWTVFFAILAPYWGYWESGFTMKSGGGKSGIPFSSRVMQFQAMSYVWDDVRKDLKPAKTNITVYRPKYIYKSQKWKHKFKNRVGITKIGIDR